MAQAVLYLVAIILLGIAAGMSFARQAIVPGFVYLAGCLALLAFTWPALAAAFGG